MPPSGVTRINQLLSPCSFETLTLDIHDLAPFSLGNESRAIPDDGAIFGKSLNVEKLSNGFAKLVDACIETMKPTQTCACRNPRSHSLFVNLMLPGESLALHRDVPEFWGLGHYNAPHWLLHLMANSSLFDNFRLPLATCVYWVSAPPGGDLILQLHAGFDEH